MLSDPMDCSLPGSSIHGIFQAGILEWGAIAFSGLLRLAQLKNNLGYAYYIHYRLEWSQGVCKVIYSFETDFIIERWWRVGVRLVTLTLSFIAMSF